MDVHTIILVSDNHNTSSESLPLHRPTFRDIKKRKNDFGNGYARLIKHSRLSPENEAPPAETMDEEYMIPFVFDLL